jgi:O-acetyl-ADP-ribose deacetylase (regulator of RNase III)
MIQFMHGNMFDVRADILVNPVNCVGVMGKGLALEFKRRWPEMFQAYRTACSQGRIRPGKVHVWCRDAWIVNVPTKNDWREPSKYEYVRAGLMALREYVDTLSYAPSIAVPALGCGNGGLDWMCVKPMMADTLGSLPNTIYVFEPEERR